MTAAPPMPVAGSAVRVTSASRAWTPARGAALPAARVARPASVADPVATTTAYPAPASTVVPLKSMQLRSAIGGAGGGLGRFSTGTDSPVNVDSSTSKSIVDKSRASAGTTSDRSVASAVPRR